MFIEHLGRREIQEGNRSLGPDLDLAAFVRLSANDNAHGNSACRCVDGVQHEWLRHRADLDSFPRSFGGLDRSGADGM